MRTPSTLWTWPRACGQRLAEQRLRRAVAEQQQPLGLGEADVLAGDFGAGLALRVGSSARRARGSRRATRCRPGRRGIPIAASMRSASSQASPPIGWPAADILERGSIAEQHDRGIFRPVREDRASRRRRGERQLRAARQPVAEARRASRGWAGRRLGAGAGSATGLARGGGGRQPVARLFLDGDIDAGLEPPGQCAARLGNADRCPLPRPRLYSSPPLTPWSRNWQGRRVELCARDAARRGRTDERTRIHAI